MFTGISPVWTGTFGSETLLAARKQIQFHNVNESSMLSRILLRSNLEIRLALEAIKVIAVAHFAALYWA